MGYTPEEYNNMKKDLQTRLKKIEGQIRGIQKMIDEDRDCGDIVIQLGAVKSAVNRVGFTVLGCHLVKGIQEGLEKNEEVTPHMEEFMKLLKKFS